MRIEDLNPGQVVYVLQDKSIAEYSVNTAGFIMVSAISGATQEKRMFCYDSAGAASDHLVCMGDDRLLLFAEKEAAKNYIKERKK